MKTKSIIITCLYWLFVFGFIIQLTSVGWYFSGVFSPNSTSVLYVHSDVRLFADSNSTLSIPVVNQSSNVDVKINQKKFGGSVMLFKTYNDVTTKAAVIFCLNSAQYLIWLLFTWQLLKVFQSLKRKHIFEYRNIWRLRIVAFVVGAAPILELVRNIIYPSLIYENISLPNHRIAYYYDFSMFAGIFYMILILLVVEIFKYGISLKQENDLTI